MLYMTLSEMLVLLGAGVRETRLAANLSQQTVAERSGVSLTALRNLEGGRNASTATLLAVCRTLRRADWVANIAPPELSDALFDRPVSGKKRQRAAAVRRRKQ